MIRDRVISACFKSLFRFFQIVHCLPNFLINLLEKKKTLHLISPPLLAPFPPAKPPLPQSTLSSLEQALILLDRRCNISSTPALPFSLTSFHLRREKTKHASSLLPAFYSQTVLHGIKVGDFVILASRRPLSTPQATLILQSMNLHILSHCLNDYFLPPPLLSIDPRRSVSF